MTNEAKREAMRDETAAVFLYLLKLEAEGIAPLYLVDNTEPVTSGGVTYTPCAFKCTLPEQNDDGASKPCRIEIDNVDRRIAEIAEETVSVQVTLTVSVVMAQNPDTTEAGPLRFILRNISISKESVQGELYDFYVYDRNLPGLRYSPRDFPGLFA
jgi:phage-related protein